MDIAQAIDKRMSVRAFKPDPIPRAKLEEILKLALRAPSWANTQPWELVVATGEPLEQIRAGFLEKVQSGQMMNSDLAAPKGFPEPYNTRRRGVGKGLFEVMGIPREDRERRMAWGMEGMKFFNAPCVIFICTGRSFYLQEEGLNIWPVFDCGLIAENIMVLAPKYGLGTVPAIQAVAYPDVIRKALSMSEEKLLVLGIPIGYPDEDHPVNRYRSQRAPLDEVAEWYGFESG
jgi:nitroreductase